MIIPKIRVWTEEGKVMYYDVYPFKDDTLLLSYDEIAFDEVPASDFILMQSTGLKDIHGEEIFEGDIVEFHDKDQSYQGIVTYDKEFGEFTLVERDGFDYSFEYLSVWYCDLSSLEVIGSKYEDPELLKGK